MYCMMLVCMVSTTTTTYWHVLTLASCQAPSQDLDCTEQVQNHTCIFNEALIKEKIPPRILWDEYGIICDIMVSLQEL